MPWLPLLLAVGMAPRLSPADQSAMSAVRHAVATLENTLSQKQFERLAPRAKVPTWQRLQHQFRYPRYGAADLAFVLAYYGVDYRQNVQRLLVPYRRWPGKVLSKTEAPDLHEEALLESLPGDLMLLYRKHHDTYSLGTLLDLQLDGAFAEMRDGVLSALWTEDPHVATILRVASGSRRRLRSIEDMLQVDGDDREVRRGNFDQLRRLSRHPDRRVAQAAKTVIADLKKAFKEGYAP